MNEIKKKFKNLTKNFGFEKNELSEIEKMYRSEEFDAQNPAYLKLLEESKKLCKKYDALLDEEEKTKRKNKNFKLPMFSYLKFYFKKNHLLKMLFPVHGFVLYAERGIEAVIGLVDLMGYGFVNRNVRFTPNSLVKVEKSNVFALNIVVGDENPKNKLSKIVFRKNSWICGGVKICGGVEVGNNCVLAAGAYVEKNVPAFSLAAGRPAKVLKKIEKNSKKEEKNCIFSEKRKQFVLKTFQNLHPAKQEKYEKILDCQTFNSIDKDISFLFRFTHNLCNEYSLPQTTSARKKEILDILFPQHGKNLKVGKNLFVDMLGTIQIGNNVEIGDDVCLGGNIIIEDDAKIEDGALVFASGHSLIAKERGMQFSLKQGFFTGTKYDWVKIANGVTVGKKSVVVPKNVVAENVMPNSLFVRGKA